MCRPIRFCVSLNVLAERKAPTKHESISLIPIEAMSRCPWTGCLDGSPPILSSALWAESLRSVPRMNVEEPYSLNRLSIVMESPQWWCSRLAWEACPSSSWLNSPRLMSVWPMYAVSESFGTLTFIPLLSSRPSSPIPEKLNKSSCESRNPPSTWPSRSP